MRRRAPARPATPAAPCARCRGAWRPSGWGRIVLDQPPSQTMTELKRALGPVMLWGLGVGYVISGMYFGWNLGLPLGGTWGMLAATIVATILYVTFIFSYTELECAIPRAGGAFDFGLRAFGPTGGLGLGVAQIVEFLFAPPAIAAAIGAYFNLFFPAASPKAIAIAAYVLFTALNAWGVKE